MLVETNNILGVGTGRIVVDNLDGTVTKIPYGDLGLQQNETEYQLSQGKIM